MPDLQDSGTPANPAKPKLLHALTLLSNATILLAACCLDHFALVMAQQLSELL